ncbi:P-loop containing nucleoside triphosphate hydrolase [Pseudocohnilembus persalinus]|uniref:DNA helicase n=1 Tax=Pseudocohnilembus persalinus TaxID=266149 RepID=A0A0V0QBM9_PSEPJ|nr:P-loop containing nucleoside triphosphate hydrolase [Pseudocohnilembus persalinus]|eukprot:KRW99547.1 P-loop containing nucleoside triphosphate hydrolase [Pseudocohnilembus persalinus]
MSQIMNSQGGQDETGRQIQQWFSDFLKKKTWIIEDKATQQKRQVKKYVVEAINMIQSKQNTLFVDAQDLMEEHSGNFLGLIQSFHRYEPFLQRAVSETTQIGQMVNIYGTVTRCTDIRPELIQGAFQCQLCNTIVKGVVQEYRYTEPKFCTNQGCQNTSEWKLYVADSIFTDMQKLRIQEDSGDIPPGGMPRSMDVILRDTVCDKVKPGDKVKVNGYLIVIPDIISLTKPGEKNMVVSRGEGIKQKNMQSTDGITGLKQLGQRDLNYKLAFVGNNIGLQFQQNKNNNGNSQGYQSDEVDQDLETYSLEEIYYQFTSEELKKIQKMQEDPQLYQNLYKSVAPTIQGQDEIKKGILLMLFGGIHKKTASQINLRGDLNVCVVGDPSTAKSQFLKYVSNFLPRSVYTSGKASTAAGLTASVQRDPETGEYCVEAGALLLADHGVCCIDEFDKMGTGDQVAIHEAMEQQTISIAKAGIQATLNARASILAAANPVFGRYDTSKSLKQNLDMSAPIMSRFDLFFVVLDQQDQNNDKNIANYILNLHQNGEEALEDYYMYSKEDMQLYLKFCRMLKPMFNKEAAQELRECYTKLRLSDQSSQQSAYKITVRQLESLIRLSESRARINGSIEITREFVKEAYRLLGSSILKIEKGEIGLEDFNANDLNNIQLNEQNQNQQNLNLLQEQIERKQRQEQQQRNTIKLSFDQYQQMCTQFIQILKDKQEEDNLYNQENPEEELRYGMKMKDLADTFIENNIDNLDLSTEERVRAQYKLLYTILKKMLENEQTIVLVEQHADYKEQKVAINDAIVE